MPRRKLMLVITKSNFGGAQRYVYDLAINLNASYDVTVASGGSGVLQKKLVSSGIRTVALPSLQRDVSLTKDTKTFFDLINLFKKERPDIVHLNSSKIGAMGALAGRIAGVSKIIFTGHGWAFNEDRPWLQKQAILFVHWLTIMLSHTTIAVSDKIKKDINTLPFVSGKIRVVHNGIGAVDFLSREEASKKLVLPSGQTFLIGTISELHKNKGLDFAIEAFALFHKKYPDSLFCIIGNGEEKEALHKLTLDRGLEGFVHFAGFVEDAVKYLKAFDVFTLTSRTEALPYAPLEAGLAKLPVIASNVGGIPEVIENKKTGLLVPVGNISTIESALEDIFTSPTHHQDYAEALHEKVVKDFSVEKMCRETAALYA